MSLGITAAGWAAIGAVGTTAVSAYGSHKAASAQEQAAQQGQDEAAREFDLSRSDTLANLAKADAYQAPYREAGQSALAKIMAGLNNPSSVLPSDPSYQFQQQQGEAGINRAAAATGAGYSGATLKALAKFNTGLASADYGANFNRLATVAGLGSTATNQTNNTASTATGQLNTLGANYTNNISALLGAQGEARASGYVSSSNAIGSGIKSLYNAYQAGPWTSSGSVENVLI